MFYYTVGVFKMELSIGRQKIHGEAIGDKMEHLEYKKEKIHSKYKVAVLGPRLMILGLKISETKQPQTLSYKKSNLYLIPFQLI